MTCFSINSNYTSTRLKRNQQNFKDIFPTLNFQENLEENFNLLSTGELQLINKLIQFDNRYRHIYFSQSYLAQILGYTREHINRMLKKIEGLGLVRLMYRHKQSCLYRVSSFFRDNDIRARLKHIFNSLTKFHISMLFPPQPSQWVKKVEEKTVSEKMSHNIIGNNFIISNPTPMRDFLWRGAVGIGDRFQKKNRESEMLLPSEKKIILEQLQQGIKPDNFPSQAIKDIDKLKLSRYGQVQLSSFPDFVINQAVKELKPDQSFGALFNACFKLCKEQSIRPDVQWVNDLKGMLKITGQESPLIAVSIKPTPTPSINQKLASQWKNDRENFDRQGSLDSVKDHMKSMAENNPALAFILGDLIK